MKSSRNLLLPFFASLLLHSVFYYLLFFDKQEKKDEQKQQRIELQLKDVIKESPKETLAPPIQEPELPPKAEPEAPKEPASEMQKSKPPKPEIPPASKKAQKQEVVKKQEGGLDTNTTKRVQKKSSPSLDEIGSAIEDTMLGELYGDEFGNYTESQKNFIKTNLKDIGLITQRYLKYPELSGRLGQEGLNVVEFYLHPNGDISELKIIKSSQYSMLDKNSLHTIEIAYKDYPQPKEKTKIRIYVHYNLY